MGYKERQWVRGDVYEPTTGVQAEMVASTLRNSSGRTLTWRHDKVIFLSGKHSAEKWTHCIRNKNFITFAYIYIDIEKINNNPMKMVSLSREQCGWRPGKTEISVSIFF